VHFALSKFRAGLVAPFLVEYRGSGIALGVNRHDHIVDLYLDFAVCAAGFFGLVADLLGGDPYLPEPQRFDPVNLGIVRWLDPAAFAAAYGSSIPFAGVFDGQLDNGGETLTLFKPGATPDQDIVIARVRYDDDPPWPAVGIGGGRSIVLIDPATNPDPAAFANWILSAREGGTPGVSGSGTDTFTGDPGTDTDGDGLTDFFEFASGSDPENPGSANLPVAAVASLDVNGVTADYFTFAFHRSPTVRGAKFTLETTSDLLTWTRADSTLTLVGSRQNPDGTATDTYRGTAPVLNSPTPAFFLMLKVEPE